MDKVERAVFIPASVRSTGKPFEVCKSAVRAGDWAAGLAAFADAANAGATPDSSALVYRAMARIRLADEPMAAIAELDAPRLRDADARVDLRRLVISPLVRGGALAAAGAVLSIALDAWPRSIDDRRLLASLLGRLKQWDDAIAHADLAAREAPGDAGLQAARIQLRLQAGSIEDAALVARATMASVGDGNESAHVWLMALMRVGDAELAARVAVQLDPTQFANERVAASAVRALLGDDRFDAAIDAGERALRAGHDGAALRSQLGQAYLARGSYKDRTELALVHFAHGVSLAPGDVRLVSLHGEALLRAGRYADSIEPLKKACELAPELDHPRAMLARALRYCGRLPEAADTLLALVDLRPERLRWQRSLIAALSQSGRKQDASALYEQYLWKRSKALPDTFMEALMQLDQKLDTAPIPQARLDWAWSLRRKDIDVDRVQWERAARWGHLIDDLLLEWLECRDDQVEEAMSLLGDLEQTERFFAPLLAAGKGFVVATAHVGPMYAGLMTLELLGIPSRWLSTTPSVSRASYARALISTADQTEAQVAKECLRALQGGFAVCLAVEGAPNPAAPRIAFEGQEITYSSFASRAAHRLGLASMFYAPRWENGKIVHTLAMLPEVRPGEDVDSYATRWQDAYLTLLRDHIAGPPENLRLNGGLWRHVRPVDRSDVAQPEHREKTSAFSRTDETSLQTVY
jgi:tetratricopeptide (TPR) repeat protein